MPTVPMLNAGGLPIDFESEYVRVEQTNDHDCLFAVFGTIAGITANDVRAIAVEQGHIPPNGYYSTIDDGRLAAFLAAHLGYVATVWKEVETTYQIKSDLAIGLIGVTDKFEGRHILFARQRNRRGYPSVVYLIDPAYWIPPELHIRAVNDGEIAWVILLHPMGDSPY